MKEYVEFIREEGCSLIEPLLRGIGGQTCRNKHWGSLRNVISAKGLLLTFISQGVFLILYLAHDHLPSGG